MDYTGNLCPWPYDGRAYYGQSGTCDLHIYGLYALWSIFLASVVLACVTAVQSIIVLRNHIATKKSKQAKIPFVYQGLTILWCLFATTMAILRMLGHFRGWSYYFLSADFIMHTIFRIQTWVGLEESFKFNIAKTSINSVKLSKSKLVVGLYVISFVLAFLDLSIGVVATASNLNPELFPDTEAVGAFREVAIYYWALVSMLLPSFIGWSTMVVSFRKTWKKLPPPGRRSERIEDLIQSMKDFLRETTVLLVVTTVFFIVVVAWRYLLDRFAWVYPIGGLGASLVNIKAIKVQTDARLGKTVSKAKKTKHHESSVGATTDESLTGGQSQRTELDTINTQTTLNETEMSQMESQRV